MLLEGFLLSIETGGKTFQIVSQKPPLPDRPGRYDGTLWPYFLLALSRDRWIEQQMMLPAAGGAAAVSWRLVGPASPAVTLHVSPIFTADRPFSRVGFEFEPERNGGRITWQPFAHFAAIIADTNGRLLAQRREAAAAVAPGTFEFQIGSNPSLLILTADTTRCQGQIDPIIGGFLAQLDDERREVARIDVTRHLLAA